MKLYKEASLMMLPTSVKDGKLYSIFPQPKPLSGELVTNGTFDTDSDWSLGSGCSISDGQAVCDGVGINSIQQSGITEIGKIYKVSFDVLDSNDFNFLLISTNFSDTYVDADLNNSVVVGTNIFYIKPTNGTGLRFRIENGTTLSIDNVSVVEVDQLPADFDFSRGSNLAATRINEQGLIEKGRENLLLQSNQFDTTWTTAGIDAPTNDFAGYDGSSNAWSLVPTSTTTSCRLAQSISTSGVNTFSVYAKANGGNGMVLRHQDSTTGARFDLSNGTLGTKESNVIKHSIENVGNGWYRCSVVLNVSITEMRIYVSDAVGSYSCTEGNGILVQDAQLEVGLVATDYIESGATTGKAGVLEDLPRLNWGDCPSLLLEPSRTNTFGNSEYFGSGLNSLVTLENNSTISPDGTQNASRIVSSQTAIGTKFWDFIGVQPGASENQVFSLFVKKYNHRYIQLIDNGDNDLYANFDIQDGVIGNYGSGATASIEDYGNGWYRCSIVCDGSQNINARNRIYLVDSLTQGYANATNVALGDGVYIWGAMQENNSSYATSYIPTHGTSVTRSADTIGTLDTTSIIGTDSYTIFVDVETENIGASSNVCGGIFNFGLPSQEFQIDTRTSKISDDSSSTSRISVDVGTDITRYKAVLRVTPNTSTVFGNGIKGESGTGRGLSPTTFNKVQDNSQVVKELTIFPTALSDNECINLTSI